MMLDYPKHKNILAQILKDIYSDSSLSPYVGFKGGTAAAMFYGLDRGSVDLDLDLLDEAREQEVFQKIQKIGAAYGKIVDSKVKRFNLLVVVSYDLKSQNIKIEVNRRNSDSKYELKTFLGISMQVMAREDMHANKLIAMSERIRKTSRDIYDVYFFEKNFWPVNKELIQKRAGISLENLLIKNIDLLEKMNNRHILDGLGELLTGPQKDWAKAKLRTDTIFLLKARLESMK